VFRLIRETLAGDDAEPKATARLAAWSAALVYASNPNLIYMQSTAMGEAIYLALFVWAVVFFGEATRGNTKALMKCGLCLAGACLTRYDGWFLTVAMAATVVIVHLLPAKAAPAKAHIPRPTLAKFILIAAAAPMLWFAYNGIVYRNPLEFENGPYSAKAIERKTQTAGNMGHPGSGNLVLAAQYFLKSGEDNVAESLWLQRAWILFALAAIAVAVTIRRRELNSLSPLSAGNWLPCLFLLIPLPFYALSVAYGGVPIFVPTWWPFSHYNVRYGLQLLPAFAAAIGILVHGNMEAHSWNRRMRMAIIGFLFAIVSVSYASIWHAGPVTLREAQVNMRSRTELEKQLATWLQKLPADSTILMFLGDHVGAVQQAGIPLAHTINEGNHRTWKQPVDREGLWERALANPSQYADYAVASDGDAVWLAAQSRHLPALVVIHTTGQAAVAVYRAR
jgi:hypothetical protein